MKVTKLLLISLFFILPFIHGKIFPTLGIDLYVNILGNFEFSKVMFFNLLISFVFLSFSIESIFMRREVFLPQIAIPLLLIIIISSYFSLSPFTSIIGDSEKGHTALTAINLLGLFCILKNLEKNFHKKLILVSLISGFFICLIAIKELFFETYDYAALSNRALGSFGHPNYLSGYLVILLPLTVYIQRTSLRYILLFVITFGIILSQSVLAVALMSGYYLYSLFGSYFLSFKKPIILSALSFLIFLGLVVIIKLSPEKLHSFLSRFYIWETTMLIIFSNIKIFLVGGGSETLPYFFNSFKVPEVYIYEKFGFTADRPHNFFLNVFYHYGIFALGLLFYFLLYLYKNFQQSPPYLSLLLFFLFGVFHFFSIASYTLIVLILALLSKNTHNLKGSITKYIVYIILFSSCVIGAYYSSTLYHAEVLLLKNNTSIESNERFKHPRYLIQLGEYEKAKGLESISSTYNFQVQISRLPEKKSLCEKFTQTYPSAENFFYCGDMFWELGKNPLAKEYYLHGLKKLPNLWDTDSHYWDNYFIKNTINGNRFFSEKFGDIRGVLKKLDIDNKLIK